MDRFSKLVILFAFLFFPLFSNAQALPSPDLPFSFVTAANQSQFQPFMYNNSNYTNVNNLAKFSASNDGSFFADVGKSVPVGGGRAIAVNARYGASAANVAGALGRFVSKIATPLVVGIALYDLAKEIGIIGKTNPDGSRSYDQQTVVPQPATYTSDGYMWIAGAGPARSTKELACQAWSVATGNPSAYPYIAATDYCYLGQSKFTLSQVGSSDCPAGTPLNSSGSCAPGALQDTIVHNPLTEEQFLQKALQSPSILPRLIQEAIKSGESLQLEPQKITGPASSPGPSSITQNSNNTKTVTNTKNEYSYGPNSVTTNVTSSTTVIDNSTGDIVGNSTTNTSPNTEQGVDICTLYPDILACQKLDTPDAPDLPTKDIPVTVAPDDGWGPASAACPAPRHATVLGRDFPVKFDLYCQFAQIIRPGVIAGAWLTAALILVGGIKQE